MPTFRRKPGDTIEADLYSGQQDNIKAICEASGGLAYVDGTGRLACKTLQGIVYANVGDWIIKGNGEVYPCGPSHMAEKYQRTFGLTTGDLAAPFEATGRTTEAVDINFPSLDAVLECPDNCIAIRQLKISERTESGLYLEKTEDINRDSKIGVVIAAGPGKLLDDGTRVPMRCKVGDVVILAKMMYVYPWGVAGPKVLMSEDHAVLGFVRRAEKPEDCKPVPEGGLD
jgi:co-chaperonin GroES (HSP10)